MDMDFRKKPGFEQSILSQKFPVWGRQLNMKSFKIQNILEV